MSNWVTKPLGELVTLQRGHDLPSQDRKEGTVPIMGSSGITGYHDAVKTLGPGVVVGRSGNSMGEVSFSEIDFWPLNTCLYVTDFKGNDERYIYYLLQTIDFDQFNSGSAQKSLNRNAVYPFEVRATECKEEQIRIGSILADLEKKIELNRQTNQTLEHMAQAIFKSWFVDFEPTRAKIAAKEEWAKRSMTTKAGGSDNNIKESQAAATFVERAAMAAISGRTIDSTNDSTAGALAGLDQLNPEQIQQLKTTAALFPDTLEGSELGEIPVGWEVSPLTSVADVIMGHSPKGDTYNDKGDGTPLVNGPVEFGNYHTKKIKWTTAPTRMSKDRDLVVCVRGSTTGRLVKSDGEYCLGRGVCAIRSAKNQPYVDYLFKSEISKLLGMTTGSTFPSWNGPVLKGHEIVRPHDYVIEAYTLVVENVELKISSFEVEAEQLASLRDSLLPKLLSGEIAQVKKV